MKLGIRRGLVMGLAVLGMVAADAAPGGATVPVNAGAFVVTGAGTITPGLGVLPQRQSFSFTTFTVTGVGTVHKQTALPVVNTSACGANGSDGVVVPGTKAQPVPYLGDSLAFGTGLGFWGCGTGPLAGKGGLLYYTRVGPLVTVTLTKHTPVAVSKETPMGVLTCVFVPRTLGPGLTFGPSVTAYDLTCVGGAADVL